MTTATVETPGRLAPTHPARKAFEDCIGSYGSLSEGIIAFNNILQVWGYYFDHEDIMAGHLHRLRIYDDSGRKFGCAYFECIYSRDICDDSVEVRGRISKHAT